jgi:hypothetical protein
VEVKTMTFDKTARTKAMKEYFTDEERDIINHALNQYYKELKGNFQGYSITMTTLALKETFARQ